MPKRKRNKKPRDTSSQQEALAVVLTGDGLEQITNELILELVLTVRSFWEREN